MKRKGAFTVLELLVSIGVLVVLGTIASSAVKELRRSGEMVREVNAGKTLISAYLTYAMDHSGQLMVAHYEGNNPAIDDASVNLPSGEVLTGGALHRYPFRLSEYFHFQIDGVLLVNQNRRTVPELFPGNQRSYGISLCPAFGINYYFAGGYMVDGEFSSPDESLFRVAQCPRPSSMLIFATAADEVDSKRVEGRFGIEPPTFKAELWKNDRSRSKLDPRHKGEVLCVFLDGSVRRHTVEELGSDMRYWSSNAQANDDPDYKVAVQGSGGIGGGGGGRR